MNLMMFLPGANEQTIRELAQVLHVEERALPLVKAKIALPILAERYDIRRVTKLATPCHCMICKKAREITEQIRIALANKTNDNNFKL